MEALTRLAQKDGILQAITSFNLSGQPARVWHLAGILRGLVAGVGKILTNPKTLRSQSAYWGSYTILETVKTGLTLKRHGNIAPDILEAVWGRGINENGSEARHYKGGQMKRIQLCGGEITGEELRNKVLEKLTS